MEFRIYHAQGLFTEPPSIDIFLRERPGRCIDETIFFDAGLQEIVLKTPVLLR
jgi:hypothetical protein